MAAWLAAEPLTTHVVVVALQCGAERPQPWQDPIARVFRRDLPTLQATICSGGVGRQHPGSSFALGLHARLSTANPAA